MTWIVTLVACCVGLALYALYLCRYAVFDSNVPIASRIKGIDANLDEFIPEPAYRLYEALVPTSQRFARHSRPQPIEPPATIGPPANIAANAALGGNEDRPDSDAASGSA